MQPRGEVTGAVGLKGYGKISGMCKSMAGECVQAPMSCGGHRGIDGRGGPCAERGPDDRSMRYVATWCIATVSRLVGKSQPAHVE